MSQFSFPRQTAFYRGKVRDVYTIADTWLVMVASNRISAFDVILPRPIPFKGQVLNQIAASMLQATTDICPNWLLEVPAPQVSIGRKCIPFKIEMVVRGNLVGHAWRTYKSGARTLCGASLPDGMQENDFFPAPLLTPSTKADAGHDEDITPGEIMARGICSAAEWEQLSTYALLLFERGRELALQRGLILADTKYEFGLLDGVITLMDEVHTPDSSRYFYTEGFDERQARGERQLQLSKEFVREWLIAHHFMGKEGQTVPEMTDDWVETISRRYIELYEKITGEAFVPQTLPDEQLYEAVTAALNRLP
ncbi:MAG TPA: phosphoribosylaminoimidazolesuccinocarboxamide synthase [Lacibacter sp.]|nr:phosphoribosylaminoimidazolesuccinocarboxamide synthase [Lacibacter sp.]HMO89679.1 phosphoribosylaminoimidazolesuccinocarboxamide synthase [Lacibacter sp.]HMP86220.1 phosphoribosylaminoimidazolesuccinocarboxamide synthase [Lacibacter sp.]